MDILWSRSEPLSVRDVHDRLAPERDLAYTTVMTVMDNLHRKEVLSRAKEGRAFRYWPTKDRANHTAELMHELLNDSGDSSVTLLRFLDNMSAAQVKKLKRALDD